MNASLAAFLTFLKTDVESDLATIGAPPVLTLLENLATHKGNKILQGADVVQFVATAPAAGLSLEAELEGQFLSLGVSWIQNQVAGAPAPADAAPATGSAGLSPAAAGKVTAKPA